MTRMLPPTPRADAPPGEFDVYAALRDAPGTDDWVALHGLPIRRHGTQVEGEADFVVLVPGEGMLVIEVKSHDRVEVGLDALWRLGNDAPTSRSPYDQAAENRYALRDWIVQHAYDVRYPVWSAAWFPRVGGELVAKLEDRVDVPRDSTFTRAEIKDLKRLVQRVVRALRSGEDALRVRGGVPFVAGQPDASAIEDALRALVPPVTWERATQEAREARDRDIAQATERQEEMLRAFARYDRLLVEGPAGTGKTNVAIRAARQAANREERVLLTCYNRKLEGMLQERMRGDDAITVARVHQLMLAISGRTAPEGADDAWWNGTLPEAALAVTRAPGYAPPFTCLVADEAQDLTRESTLAFLDSVVAGGLAGARVVLAGDFERQDIYRARAAAPLVKEPAPSPSPEEPAPSPLVEEPAGAAGARLETTTPALTRLLPRLPDAGRMSLDINVRQHPQLAQFVEQMMAADLYGDYGRADDELECADVWEYATDDEQDALLRTALETLHSEGWDAPDILVLAPRRDSAARRATGVVRERLASTGGAGDGIRWGTVHLFKGLEAPAVVLTDVDASSPGWQDLLYVGMTRATERVVVLRRTPPRDGAVEA